MERHSDIGRSAMPAFLASQASSARKASNFRSSCVFRKIITGSIIAGLMASAASADTLREALISAYQTNPTLTAQRESLRATDATVAIARAAGRPQVSGTVGLNRDLTRSGILDTGANKGPSVSAGVDFSYPLFNGGSVRNNINAAQTRVEAGRATLRA